MKQYLNEFFFGYDPTDYYGDIKGSIALVVFHAVMAVFVIGIFG